MSCPLCKKETDGFCEGVCPECFNMNTSDMVNMLVNYQAENQRLNAIIAAVKEWAIVDFNESLLGFIKQIEECKSKEKIESKLKGE